MQLLHGGKYDRLLLLRGNNWCMGDGESGDVEADLRPHRGRHSGHDPALLWGCLCCSHSYLLQKRLRFFLLQKHVSALALSAHRSSLVSQWVHLLSSLISSSFLSLICMSTTQADLNHTQ